MYRYDNTIYEEAIEVGPTPTADELAALPERTLPVELCSKGLHPMTPANRRVLPNGYVRCRLCHRKAERERYHRVVAERRARGELA